MTTHLPSVFSVKCHPIMSLPLSDDGRCLVGPDSRVSGVIALWPWSVARNVLSRGNASRSWARESLDYVGSAAVATFSVSARSWSNLLAPGTTSGAGNKMMLSVIRMELVSWTRQR